MTICVCVKVPDGLVLAADSMASYPVHNPTTQGWDVVQSYSYANKLIRIGSLQMGVLVWGSASLQRRSMENLVLEFASKPGVSHNDVKTTAGELAAFIAGIYQTEYPDPNQRPLLGFLVGGYDSTHPFARLWAFEFPLTMTPIELLHGPSGPIFGVQWFGQTDALVRLMNGFDMKIVSAMKGKGFDPQLVDDFFSPGQLAQSGVAYNIIFDGMPLQDAIDYAAYLVHVVKGRFRFVVGPKVCGGPVDIAVVKPSSFEWIKRKNLSHDHEI